MLVWELNGTQIVVIARTIRNRSFQYSRVVFSSALAFVIIIFTIFIYPRYKASDKKRSETDCDTIRKQNDQLILYFYIVASCHRSCSLFQFIFVVLEFLNISLNNTVKLKRKKNTLANKISITVQIIHLNHVIKKYQAAVTVIE